MISIYIFWFFPLILFCRVPWFFQRPNEWDLKLLSFFFEIYIFSIRIKSNEWRLREILLTRRYTYFLYIISILDLRILIFISCHRDSSSRDSSPRNSIESGLNPIPGSIRTWGLKTELICVRFTKFSSNRVTCDILI